MRGEDDQTRTSQLAALHAASEEVLAEPALDTSLDGCDFSDSSATLTNTCARVYIAIDRALLDESNRMRSLGEVSWSRHDLGSDTMIMSGFVSSLLQNTSLLDAVKAHRTEAMSSAWEGWVAVKLSDLSSMCTTM